MADPKIIVLSQATGSQRYEAELIAEAIGAKIRGSVSSETDLVVVCSRGFTETLKITKAQELGVPTMNWVAFESEFGRRVGARVRPPKVKYARLMDQITALKTSTADLHGIKEFGGFPIQNAEHAAKLVATVFYYANRFKWDLGREYVKMIEELENPK